jgi:hypothetical protein
LEKSIGKNEVPFTTSALQAKNEGAGLLLRIFWVFCMDTGGFSTYEILLEPLSCIGGWNGNRKVRLERYITQKIPLVDGKKVARTRAGLVNIS